MKRLLLFTLTLLVAVAVEAKPKWHEQYRYDRFKVAERSCTVVHPTTTPNGRWIVRPAFLGAFPSVDDALLAKGFTVAYCDVTHAYANPRAVADFEEFYHTMRERYGLRERFIIEGFSRGGFFALTYAIQHPEQIEKIYVDAPVCDLKSWPSPQEAKLYAEAVRLWEEAGASFEEHHDYPIRHFHRIVEAGIPVIVCYGEADEIVPYEENFGRIAAQYGRRIKQIGKPACGHHPHSLDNPKRIVRFLK
ncbi:MAG: alpha/beta fold hydrolase [Alistipes sp.]|nr:alpha/beta fold hydrolase [Alistipes sp.]